MSTDGHDLKAIYSRLYREHFDLRGSGYPQLAYSFNKWLYRVYWRALVRLLADHDVTIAGKRVLEFASGSGFFTGLLCGLDPAGLTGVDITSESAGELEKRYPSHQFIQGDISDPGLDPPGGPFDFSCAFNVIYHVLDDDKFRRTVINLGRFLNRGGFAVLNDTLPPESTAARGHVRFRSMKMFEEAFGPSGLEVVEVRPVQFWGAEPVGDGSSPSVKKAARTWSRLSRQAWKSEFRGYLAGSLFYFMNSPRKVDDPFSLPFNKFILVRKS